MRRRTHLLLGAAVGIPIAASLSPALAIGGLWWGAVGGGFPDWLDLRSDFRRSLRLRHRGASHGILVLILISTVFGVGLLALVGLQITAFGFDGSIPDQVMRPWTLCFVLGMVSHLASDAMTHGGIRPLLPFHSVKIWLLPGFLRSRYDGYLDVVVWVASGLAIGIGVSIYVSKWM